MKYTGNLLPEFYGGHSSTFWFINGVFVFLLLMSIAAHLWGDSPKNKLKTYISGQKIDYIYQILLLAGAILVGNLAGICLRRFEIFGVFYQIFTATLIFMGTLFLLTLYYLNRKMVGEEFYKQLTSIFQFRLLLNGVVDYFRIVPVVWIFSIANFYILYYFEFTWTQPVTYQFLILADNKVKLVLLALLIIVVAPLVEEIFFRGSFYSLLRDKLSFPAAAFFSGVFFALVHFDLNYLPSLLLIGYLLGRQYENSGNLAGPVAFHGVHNMIVMVLYFWIFW